ncbi:MAG: GNAT family N-acetyltransferase [Chthonomonadaceae bacterium]|nr:GNAT family N-acetyltransferase [Chthonomonadaceae bacterium]
MNAEKQAEILNLLDFERRTVIYPGVTRSKDTEIVRDISEDGKSGEIVYSSCSEIGIDRAIKHEIQRSREERYDLEWKVYGHDLPPCLSEHLVLAGFTAGAKEAFLVLVTSDESVKRFAIGDADIRRITSREGLSGYQGIIEEVRGKSCEREIEQYGFMLENHPDSISLYVAYVDGEPAACGRVYFCKESKFAALYGGNTRERFRRRGLFTQIVAARTQEALSRGIVNICVDALPTSEPILKKQGFEKVTDTQPFRFSE